MPCLMHHDMWACLCSRASSSAIPGMLDWSFTCYVTLSASVSQINQRRSSSSHGGLLDFESQKVGWRWSTYRVDSDLAQEPRLDLPGRQVSVANVASQQPRSAMEVARYMCGLSSSGLIAMGARGARASGGSHVGWQGNRQPDLDPAHLILFEQVTSHNQRTAKSDQAGMVHTGAG